jgi:hypothetical protein
VVHLYSTLTRTQQKLSDKKHRQPAGQALLTTHFRRSPQAPGRLDLVSYSSCIAYSPVMDLGLYLLDLPPPPGLPNKFYDNSKTLGHVIIPSQEHYLHGTAQHRENKDKHLCPKGIRIRNPVYERLGPKGHTSDRATTGSASWNWLTMHFF